MQSRYSGVSAAPRPCSRRSVAADAPAVEIYELPHVGHERLLLLWP
jgi:hypothetical protein